MEIYKIVYDIVSTHEGGYVHNLDGDGKDTYAGITELNFPKWEGWKIINKHKPLKRGQLINDDKLKKLVSDFYTKDYLKPAIDFINTLNPKPDASNIALLLDNEINFGKTQGIKLYKKAHKIA